jgi:hypothetical protein
MAAPNCQIVGPHSSLIYQVLFFYKIIIVLENMPGLTREDVLGEKVKILLLSLHFQHAHPLHKFGARRTLPSDRCKAHNQPCLILHLSAPLQALYVFHFFFHSTLIRP